MIDITKRTKYERIIDWCVCWVNRNKVPFFATLLFGLLSHMFAFTNKFPNDDDIYQLFGKGWTIGSGRWGLELMRIVFPDFSMPWIYGVISLILIAIAVSITVRLFSIRSSILQALLAGLVISFPSLTGTFCYMFTSTSYAVSFLLSVIAVDLYLKEDWKKTVLASILCIFALSIYQAYISIVASFFLIVLIQRIVLEKSIWKEILAGGLRMVCFLCVVLAVYYVSVHLALHVTNTKFTNLAESNFTTETVNLLRRVYVAYANFAYLFTRSRWGLIGTPVSCIAHLILIAVSIAETLHSRNKKWKNTFLLVLLAVVFPLAINCMYLITEEEAVHTLVLYGFVSAYVLVIVLMEALMQRRYFAKDILLSALTVILIGNIYVANQTYLNMHIAYENAYSFYTSLIGQVKQTPGFDEEKKLALIGESENLVHYADELGGNYIKGLNQDLINVYSREQYIKYYIGFDIQFASEEEKSEIIETATFEKMPEYPWYGSVAIIDDYVVVKLDEDVPF